ncbi:hypothetical protein D9613_002762 [Agrocybe pediades]|uniref:Blue (type 1) copper domain-containing protein n=1 Tax=Agrocybe pediades TaxID=84607 RepID=A0A8H4QRU6_9AGAR|nr:hypothetical protein D9613_002762 [Agrocybe pediades]KAF9562191.1 hypothetical protein CPC08DRAFT_688098 [Agrocybe pediades]
MLTKSLSILSLLPGFVLAQGYYPPPQGNTSPTSSSAATVPTAPPGNSTNINVNVAPGGQLVFQPSNFNAPVGAVVTFFFPAALAHSVTQSTFANPCTHLEATSNSSAGFDSDLVTTSTFTITINDTEPIWFHCKQAQHCGQGMVGSINAPSTGDQTFDNFKAAAAKLGSNAPLESTTGAVTGGVHGIATAAPSSDVGGGSSTKPSSATRVAASAGLALLSVIGISML